MATKPKIKTESKPSKGKKPTAPKSAGTGGASPFGIGVWPGSGFTAPTTPKSMESMMSKTQSSYDAFSRDGNAALKAGMEAWAQSGKICAERMQEIVSTCVSMCQNASEKQAANLQKLMGCKTINELTDCQNKLAQQSFDELMSTMTRMTEMTIKMATEAIEPINDQWGRAIKKTTDNLAA